MKLSRQYAPIAIDELSDDLKRISRAEENPSHGIAVEKARRFLAFDLTFCVLLLRD